MATLPNEVLDIIVDSVVEDLSSCSVFSVTLAHQLKTLLRAIALVSRYLRDRAQRHLFVEIRLHALQRYNRDSKGVSSRIDRSLSIFDDNPRLLGYPRSLVITDPHWDSGFSPYFLSVALPFFTDKLRKIEHLELSLHHQCRWITLPRQLQDGIVRLLEGSSLKSLKIQQFGLPLELVEILPPSLEALHANAYIEPDPAFASRYIQTRTSRRSRRAASPAHLEVRLQGNNPVEGWIPGQADAFFQSVKSLHVEITSTAQFTTFMSRMPETLTHLSLRHKGIPYGTSTIALILSSLSRCSQRKTPGHRFGDYVVLQPVNIPFMPCLEELNVSVAVESAKDACFPAMAVMIAEAYITPAHASICVFQLVIEWKSLKAHIGRLVPNDVFARLDDLLSDPSKLASLREVEIGLRPGYFGWVDYELARQRREKFESEALEAFPRTIERVDSFSVTVFDPA
jgi:hypothetical protein